MSTPRAASLLALPRELRDEIWTLTVTSEPTRIGLHAHTPGAVPISAVPAILHTSQQIHREASKIFYKHTFETTLNRRPRKLQQTKDGSVFTRQPCWWRA